MATKAKRNRTTAKPKPNARLRKFLESARAHGVKPIKDFEKFLDEMGDVWPEHENVDDFIAWYRKGRKTGRYE
jgi:hypothetical protein